MFHLLKELTQTYTWPVVACVPANGGNITRIKFDAEFKRISAERIREMNDPTCESRPKTDPELLAEVLVELKSKDEAGQYGPISESDVAELRAVSGVDKYIALAFYASLSGEKAKN